MLLHLEHCRLRLTPSGSLRESSTLVWDDWQQGQYIIPIAPSDYRYENLFWKNYSNLNIPPISYVCNIVGLHTSEIALNLFVVAVGHRP